MTVLMLPTTLLASVAPQAAAATAGCPALGVVAHRGFHPPTIDENSLPAIRRAATLGMAVEFDVRADADGRLWLFHDRDTLRATGVSYLFDQLTSAQVEQLRYVKAGSPIAPLDAVMAILQDFPDTEAYIEPKQRSMAADLARALVATGRLSATWVTAFGSDVHAEAPEVKLLEKVATAPAPADLVARSVSIVSLFPGDLSVGLVEDYRASGISVMGRNANTARAWERTLAAGAASQVTDDPQGLSKYCAAR